SQQVQAQETAPPVTTPEAAPSTTPDAVTPASPTVVERNAEILSAISTLSPLIGDVQIVGPWVEGERSGVWRTIMTQA
ncbi:hypothetical protein, partial [Vibrio cholerae]|uniref:hypothetical protein n=1 Tax=Vibrio cholerae TaxID=666 RepID=UPI00184438A9